MAQLGELLFFAGATFIGFVWLLVISVAVLRVKARGRL